MTDNILILKKENNGFEKYYSNCIRHHGVKCEEARIRTNGIRGLIIRACVSQYIRHRCLDDNIFDNEQKKAAE